MKFLTFDSVARQLCAQMGDPTGKKLLIVSRTLKSVLDQLDLHVFPHVKSGRFTVQSNLTIDLPSDVAKVLKVGTLLSDGTLRILGLEENLIAPIEESACECAAVDNSADTSTVTTCPACTFHGCWFPNGQFGELYGYRTPQFINGKWRPDYGNNRVILSSGTDVEAGSTLIMEYKPDTDADNRMIQIPKDAYTMLMYRVFQLIDSYGNPGKAQTYARMFKIEYDTFKQSNSHLSVEDIISAFRGESMSAIKR